MSFSWNMRKTDAYVSELFSWLKDYMEHGSMEETLKKAESEYREEESRADIKGGRTYLEEGDRETGDLS